MPADEMADADRARVGHDRERALAQAPVACGGAVEDLLDALDLDEVVAAADRADLAVARERLARAADEVVQREHAVGGERAELVRAHEIALLRRLVPQGPHALAGVGAVEQPLDAIAEDAGALACAEGDVAAALEEDVAQAGVEIGPQPRELVGGDVGRQQPHAAADVGADRLGQHEASRIEHGADGDAGAAMEVGRQDDTVEPRGGVREVVPRVEGRQRVDDGGEVQDLLDAGGVEKDLGVGEEDDVEIIARTNPDPVRVDALQCRMHDRLPVQGPWVQQPRHLRQAALRWGIGRLVSMGMGAC